MIVPFGEINCGYVADPTDDALYRGFADAVGGQENEIRAHRALFVTDTKTASIGSGGLPIVDIGCGRGEFLELLRDAGVPVIGVDTSESQGAILRGRGFDVRTEDAVGYLAGCADGSLGGVTSFNVVEHMQAEYFVRFVRLLAAKVAHGGCVVLHTSNPECPFEMGVFWSDITHVRPYHPATIGCYLGLLGFGSLRTVYYDPAPIPVRTSAADASAYRTFAVVGTRA